MDALSFLNRLKRIDVEAVARQVLQDNIDRIPEYNASQLAQGIRADGSPTLPDYSPVTIELKKQSSGLAAVTDRVTLFQTGSFYRGLFAALRGDTIIFDSRDSKADSLDKKYSTARGSIFGLSPDNRQEFISQFLRPQFIQKIKTLLSP